MKRFLLLILLILTLGCGQSTWSSKQVDRGALMHLHNEARAESGADELQIDLELDEYAQTHAEWMAQRESLKHSSLQGDYPMMGENIAAGQTSEPQVVGDWMNSSGHRRNILNKRFEYVGFGYAESRRGTPYWCTIFGGR